MEFRNNNLLLALTGILSITLAIVASVKFIPRTPPVKAQLKPIEYTTTTPSGKKTSNNLKEQTENILDETVRPEFDERQAVAVTEKVACRANVSAINQMAEKWWIDHDGQYPKDNLSDMGRDEDYFPNGIPRCPVDGSPYRLDPHTHRIAGHLHAEIDEWALFNKITGKQKPKNQPGNSE